MRKNRSAYNLWNFTRWLICLPLSACLYGCPYNSSYQIDDAPQILADDIFVGKWSALVTDDAEVQSIKMLVSKKNDYEYDINFIGRINGLRNFTVLSNDTLKASAFFSETASRRFLNIEIKGQTYIAEFIYKNDKISILPLNEHFTSKIIKNNAELKLAVEYHFKTRLYPLYDYEFAIRELTRMKDME